MGLQAGEPHAPQIGKLLHLFLCIPFLVFTSVKCALNSNGKFDSTTVSRASGDQAHTCLFLLCLSCFGFAKLLYLKKSLIYLFLAVLGLHCSMGSSLVVVTGGYSLLLCEGFS